MKKKYLEILLVSFIISNIYLIVLGGIITIQYNWNWEIMLDYAIIGWLLSIPTSIFVYFSILNWETVNKIKQK